MAIIDWITFHPSPGAVAVRIEKDEEPAELVLLEDREPPLDRDVRGDGEETSPRPSRPAPPGSLPRSARDEEHAEEDAREDQRRAEVGLEDDQAHGQADVEQGADEVERRVDASPGRRCLASVTMIASLANSAGCSCTGPMTSQRLAPLDVGRKQRDRRPRRRGCPGRSTGQIRRPLPIIKGGAAPPRRMPDDGPDQLAPDEVEGVARGERIGGAVYGDQTEGDER